MAKPAMSDEEPAINDNAAHILIADDQLENLLVLEAFLADAYVVHGVADGQQVLDYLDAGQPADLILLDVVMPRMDGFETCRRIKAESASQDIPVLFLSSLESPQHFDPDVLDSLLAEEMNFREIARQFADAD